MMGRLGGKFIGLGAREASPVPPPPPPLVPAINSSCEGVGLVRVCRRDQLQM